MNVIGMYGWAPFALLFFVILVSIYLFRLRERKWIERRFAGKKTIIESYGVKCFGLKTGDEPPRPVGGFLVLFPDRLYFKAHFKNVELDLSKQAVTAVDHDHAFKGVELHQSIMTVSFTNNQAQEDAAAFRVPYPPQWMKAIQSILIDTEE